MRCRLARVARQLLAVGPHGNQEGVDAHRPAKGRRIGVSKPDRRLRGSLTHASCASQYMRRTACAKGRGTYYSDFASELVLDLAGLDRVWRMFGNHLVQICCC